MSWFPSPRAQSTWAVSITAPSERVWPWLVQMGQDRAGFYTYEWFENRLPRLDIHNADRIVPEWQNVQVGDRLWFYPADSSLGARARRPGSTSWRSLRTSLMTQGMMLGIKRRAEMKQLEG